MLVSCCLRGHGVCASRRCSHVVNRQVARVSVAGPMASDCIDCALRDSAASALVKDNMTGMVQHDKCMAIDPDFSLREAGCARARSSARPASTTVQCTMQCNDIKLKNEGLVFACCHRPCCAGCTPRSLKTRFSLLFTAAQVRRAAHKSVFTAVMLSAMCDLPPLSGSAACKSRRRSSELQRFIG